MAFSSRAHLLDALSALGKWLDQQPAASIPSRLDFFVCGGACFLFHELPRYLGVTNDVDVWCQFENEKVIPIMEWSSLLERGIEVARKQFPTPFPQGWLSCEASVKVAIHFGLPPGAKGRATAVDFGSRLRMFFSARQDLVAFKFLALIVAQRPNTRQKAREDLLALIPTLVEVEAARNWLLNAPKANQLWKGDCVKELSQWQQESS
jgi:hypothetical protein